MNNFTLIFLCGLYLVDMNHRLILSAGAVDVVDSNSHILFKTAIL